MSGFEQELLDRYAGARERLWGAASREVVSTVSKDRLARVAADKARLRRLNFRTEIVFVNEGEVLAPEAKRGRTASGQIANEVAAKHRVSIAEIRDTTRVPRVVHARQELMWRLHHETIMSMPEIGRKLNRDHTTVLHGIRAHELRMAGVPDRRLRPVISPVSPITTPTASLTSLTLVNRSEASQERSGTA